MENSVKKTNVPLMGGWKLNPVEIMVLKGLVSGDGDIGGRMASGHPDARPPVDKKRMPFLQFIADVHIKAGTPLNKLDEIHAIKRSAPQ